jgi:hypothetical protein
VCQDCSSEDCWPCSMLPETYYRSGNSGVTGAGGVFGGAAGDSVPVATAATAVQVTPTGKSAKEKQQQQAAAAVSAVTTKVRICKTCDNLMNKLVAALKAGDLPLVKSLHLTGNVNLHNPFTVFPDAPYAVSF